MNWIEIDNLLYRMIERHTNKKIIDVDSVYEEAKKQFKWNDSQAISAINPLVSRIDRLAITKNTITPKKKRKSK